MKINESGWGNGKKREGGETAGRRIDLFIEGCNLDLKLRGGRLM